MSRARLGEAFEVRLPSGRAVTVRAKRLADPPRDLPEALLRGAVELSVEAATLALSDANVLEGIAAALSAIEPPVVPLACRNCGEQVELEPAKALPLAPLLAPLDDPELDPARHREPADEWHPLPRPVRLARQGEATRFLLAKRTFDDRLQLEGILGDDHDAPLPFAPPLLRAIGVAALGDDAAVLTKSAIAITRALDALDDETFGETFDAIARAWDQQHYPPRLLAAVPCPRCGARHDVEVVPRALDWITPRAASAEAEFPSLEAFREKARAITREVLAEQQLSDAEGLEVLVEDDVPPCDDGGEPLLGSYTPNLGADGDVRAASTSPFTIALYYRTFASMFDDEPYDVDAEIRETIEHELEHHVNFLSGDDPLDEEERREISAERGRRLGVSAPMDELSAGVSWLASDFARFLAVTWPIWVLALLGLVVWLANAG